MFEKFYQKMKDFEIVYGVTQDRSWYFLYMRSFTGNYLQLVYQIR